MLFTTTIKQRYYLEQDANDRQDKKQKQNDRSSSIYFLQEPCTDLNGVGGENQSYYIHIVKLLLMYLGPPGKDNCSSDSPSPTRKKTFLEPCMGAFLGDIISLDKFSL